MSDALKDKGEDRRKKMGRKEKGLMKGGGIKD